MRYRQRHTGTGTGTGTGPGTGPARPVLLRPVPVISHKIDSRQQLRLRNAKYHYALHAVFSYVQRRNPTPYRTVPENAEGPDEKRAGHS